MNEIKLGGIKFPKKSRPLSPPKNSPDKDIWMTPPDLARKIVQHFAPSGLMIEPCAGENAFWDAMREVVPDGQPLPDSYELSRGRDFLLTDLSSYKYDWLITNFPFSKYADFLEKSMQVAENIITYGTVCHVLSLKKRLRLIKEAGFFIREILYTDTPKEWNTGGFQCGAILLTRQRGDCKISYL